jgi:hypothetical protein
LRAGIRVLVGAAEWTILRICGKDAEKVLARGRPRYSGLRADLRREIDWWENQKAALGTLEQI